MVAQQNKYTQRFLDMYEKIYDPSNGYFSADGVPYHSIETLMCEAPDYGHETTSEAYSYWIWLDAMYGGVTGNWSPLNDSWLKMEEFAIPTDELQPTNGDYDPNSPATYAAEYGEPTYYPSELKSNVPVGKDPVSDDLTAAYGANIYGMHWLFDCDNTYGYGNKGDGVSTPSYINSFQRGEQESVWETVPQPSWEDFSWGSDDGTGFLKLFTKEANAPSKQWRYTNAPDADARVVQAMYWASEFAKEQGLDPTSTIPMSKASKMGDFVRLSMFDKYFKPIGVQSLDAAGGTGYESAHYLLSWYYAWGGPLTSQGWAWRIGCSHVHFGYQNPVAAYALSEYDNLIPSSTNGSRDWAISLDRQLEFYTWLQSAEGGIAGGATNSYNGVYDEYPSGTATFYDMAYTEHPVYHDPGSNRWFGMQAWSMERIAELYYIDNDSRAKTLMDNWIAWVKTVVHLLDDGTFEIPSNLLWTGQPNTWNPDNPTTNSDLHVTVDTYNVDLGIAGCLAKALIYYAAATEKYETLDVEAKDLAKELLDRMWNNYYEEDGAGYSVVETRSDYTRLFEQEVYVPDGWSGTMSNGDVIEPGIKFIDIRSFYLSDPDFAELEANYKAGTDYKASYHRFWAEADIALANAEYGRLFGDGTDTVPTSISISTNELLLEITDSEELTATVLPTYASNEISWTSNNTSIATVNSNGIVVAKSEGTALVIATTVVGGLSDTCIITVVDEIPEYTLTVTTTGSGSVSLDPIGGVYSANTVVTLVATASTGYTFENWTGDLSGTATTSTITIDADKSVTANFVEEDSPCENPSSISIPLSQNGAGEYCYSTDDEIGFINSWNMEVVEINGIDFTNSYSSSFPDKIDGKYYIYLKANYAWSHFEASLAKTTDINTEDNALYSISLYPNPFKNGLNIEIPNIDSVKRILITDQLGRVISEIEKSDITTSMTVGNDLDKGIYLIVVQSKTGNKTYKIIKQ